MDKKSATFARKKIRSLSWGGILANFSFGKREQTPEHSPLPEESLETSTSSEIPDYVVLQKLLQEYNSAGGLNSETSSTQLLKSENAQLIEFLYSNYKRRQVERKHYINLISFLAFLFLYLTVLTIQQSCSSQYELTTSILDDIFPKDENGERAEALLNKEEVYQWLEEEVVTKIWKEPVCGDGLCERPIEHEAFGRFGCRVDCGEVPTSPVHIVLSEAAKSSAEGVMPRVNVCHRHFMLSESSRLCWFSQDLSVPLASGSSSSSSSEDLELWLDIPDGEWELIIKGVGGTLGSLFGGLQVHQPEQVGNDDGIYVGNNEPPPSSETYSGTSDSNPGLDSDTYADFVFPMEEPAGPDLEDSDTENSASISEDPGLLTGSENGEDDSEQEGNTEAGVEPEPRGGRRLLNEVDGSLPPALIRPARILTSNPNPKRGKEDNVTNASASSSPPPVPPSPSHVVSWEVWVEKMKAESDVVLPTYEFCHRAFQELKANLPEICTSLWSDAQCCPHFETVFESNCFCTSAWKDDEDLKDLVDDYNQGCPGQLLQGKDCPILSPVMHLDDRPSVNEAACFHTFENDFQDKFIENYCWDDFRPTLCCPAVEVLGNEICWCSTAFSFMRAELRHAFYVVAERCGLNTSAIDCSLYEDRMRYIVPVPSVFQSMKRVLTTRSTRELEREFNHQLISGSVESTGGGSFPEVCVPQNVPVDCDKALELLYFWCSWHGERECSDECGMLLCSSAITEACSFVEVKITSNPYSFFWYESTQYGPVESAFRDKRAQNCWDENITDITSGLVDNLHYGESDPNFNQQYQDYLLQLSYSGECQHFNEICTQTAFAVRTVLSRCLRESDSPILRSKENFNAWQEYITEGGGVALLCLLFNGKFTSTYTGEMRMNMGCDQLIGTLRAESSMFNLMLAHENYDGDCIFHAHCPSGQFCGLTLTASGNTSCMDCSMCCAPPVGSGAYNGSEPGCGHCSCDLCSPGCTQDMLTNFKCDAECFTEECNWDGHACSYELTYSPDVECPSDQSWEFWSRVVVPKTNQSLSQAACCRTKDVHDEVVPFSVWGHTSTDHHSSSSSFNSSSNSSSSSSSTASLSMLQENLSGNSSFTRLIANTNKILAGALLNVRRFEKTNCVNAAKFANLYDMCRGEEVTVPYGNDPVFQIGSSLYNVNISAHRDDFYPNTEEYINQFGVPYGFHHHKMSGKEKGYPVLLDVNLKASRANDWMTYLQEGNYLDTFTSSFSVELVTFNGNYGFFTYVKILFQFTESGRIKVDHFLQHLNAAIYSQRLGLFQFGLEILLVCCILTNWYTELQEFTTMLRRTRSIWPYFRKFSNRLDVLSLCLFALIVCTWIGNIYVMMVMYEIDADYHIYEDLLADGNWLRLAEDRNGLDDFSKSMHHASMTAMFMDGYMLLNGINILLMLGRLLKLMDFHQDVGMVTRTMKEAGNDLINFMVLCLTLIVAYAMMGSFLFGSMIGRMSDPGRAMQTLLLAMVGEFEAFSQEMENSTGLTVISIYIFFWSYMLLVYLILLNALLAIIVSAMDVIKNADAHRESTHFFSEMTDVGFYYLSTSADTCKRRLMGLVAFLPGFRHIRPNPDRILNEDEIFNEISHWVDLNKAGNRSGKRNSKRCSLAGMMAHCPKDIYDDKVLRFGARALTLGALQKMLAAARQEAIVTDRLLPVGSEMAKENANLSVNLGEESMEDLTSASIDVVEDGVPMEGMARGVLRQFGRDDDLVRKLIDKGITSDLKKKAVQKRIFDERWKRGVSDRISRVENVMDGVSERVGRVEHVMESVLDTLQRLEGRFGGPPTESTPSVVGSEIPETLIRPAMSLDTGMGAIAQGVFTVHEDEFTSSLKGVQEVDDTSLCPTTIEYFETNPVFQSTPSIDPETSDEIILPEGVPKT